MQLIKDARLPLDINSICKSEKSERCDDYKSIVDQVAVITSKGNAISVVMSCFTFLIGSRFSNRFDSFLAL